MTPQIPPREQWTRKTWARVIEDAYDEGHRDGWRAGVASAYSVRGRVEEAVERRHEEARTGVYSTRQQRKDAASARSVAELFGVTR